MTFYYQSECLGYHEISVKKGVTWGDLITLYESKPLFDNHYLGLYGDLVSLNPGVDYEEIQYEGDSVNVNDEVIEGAIYSGLSENQCDDY